MIQNNMFSTQGIQPLQMKKLQPKVSLLHQPKPFRASVQYDNALGSVAAQEAQSHEMSNGFLVGKANVDQVMIASEQSPSLSLQLTTQVRNKVVEAYQEVMRTQL